MLTENQILDAINAQLCRHFPNRMVYVNLQSNEFERPSFFIRSDRKNTFPATRFTVARTETYIITVFEPVDECGASKLTELSASQAQVAALFLHPFRCEDRWFTAAVSSPAITELASAEVELTITFHDDMTEGLLEPFADEPLMRTLQFNSNNEYSEVITDGSSDS